jgi:hypothetical protein
MPWNSNILHKVYVDDKYRISFPQVVKKKMTRYELWDHLFVLVLDDAGKRIGLAPGTRYVGPTPCCMIACDDRERVLLPSQVRRHLVTSWSIDVDPMKCVYFEINIDLTITPGIAYFSPARPLSR